MTATAIDTFRTQRLGAERLRPAHLAELVAMHKTPEVMATLGGMRSAGKTEEYLGKNLAHWERYGFGLWIFRDPQGTFAGRGGIRHIDIEGKDEVEVAYSLMQPYWGRGLATEMAEASLRIAFDHFSLPNCIGITTQDNIASQRVMEKMGFEFESEVAYEAMQCELYRITP